MLPPTISFDALLRRRLQDANAIDGGRLLVILEFRPRVENEAGDVAFEQHPLVVPLAERFAVDEVAAPPQIVDADVGEAREGVAPRGQFRPPRALATPLIPSRSKVR